MTEPFRETCEKWNPRMNRSSDATFDSCLFLLFSTPLYQIRSRMNAMKTPQNCQQNKKEAENRDGA